jgi:hypothetical protein
VGTGKSGELPHLAFLAGVSLVAGVALLLATRHAGCGSCSDAVVLSVSLGPLPFLFAIAGLSYRHRWTTWMDLIRADLAVAVPFCAALVVPMSGEIGVVIAVAVVAILLLAPAVGIGLGLIRLVAGTRAAPLRPDTQLEPGYR